MKSIKNLIVLLIVFSMLLLSSCNQPYIGENGEVLDMVFFYPEGYTGGFPDANYHPGFQSEFCWVETYEECLEAIELLKYHGSTFVKTAIFTYEGELFDTKYCFKIPHNRLTEEIEFGDNPFDRRGYGVEIISFAFREDVSIDEIVYGDVYDYKCSRLYFHYSYSVLESQPKFTYKDLKCEWTETDISRFFYVYNIKQKGWNIKLNSFGYPNETEYSIQCVEAVLKSLVLIWEE